MRKVTVENAVGQALGHDITRIIPGQLKQRAFKRGHIVTLEDVSRLKDLGKEHIFIWDDQDPLIHEDDAAVRLAEHALGDGLGWTGPNQGRVNFCSELNGVFKVDVERLHALNSLEHLVFATIHNNRIVSPGQTVAGARVVPLAIEPEILAEAEKICSEPSPLLSVKAFKPLWVAVIITGSEVNSGRIKDGFARIIRQKIAPFGGRWMGQVIVPDDPEVIAYDIQNFIAEGAELILVTGGMSVDADDASPRAIKQCGAEVVFHGAPVLPGSQFMLAYQGSVAICGVPGGALFSRKTTLDLMLPRIFVKEHINRSDIVSLGHGGFCEECIICNYPMCPFGKAGQI